MREEVGRSKAEGEGRRLRIIGILGKGEVED